MSYISSRSSLVYSRVNISGEDSENIFGSNIEGIFIDVTPFYTSEHLNIFSKYFIIIQIEIAEHCLTSDTEVEKNFNRWTSINILVYHM